MLYSSAVIRQMADASKSYKRWQSAVCRLALRGIVKDGAMAVIARQAARRRASTQRLMLARQQTAAAKRAQRANIPRAYRPPFQRHSSHVTQRDARPSDAATCVKSGVKNAREKIEMAPGQMSVISFPTLMLLPPAVRVCQATGVR